MEVFDLRNQLIHDYETYIKSFITIGDSRIRAHVDAELQQGLLWPEPLLQLNPNFEPGEQIDDLVDDGTLAPGIKAIFRLKGEDGSSKPLRLHRHQSAAVRAAQSGDNYILTTGTGSGKSLAYIIPIVEQVLRTGSGKGIRAIVIYPMNALANSQFNELEKFLCRGFPAGKPPVTFALYTGQEDEEKRKAIMAHPPDILLTNYVMLELLLTRPEEKKKIINAARGSLQFLVLDELHTYRGRQGADVALLIRRVRDICENSALQCVGTSATLAGGKTFAEQQAKIAEVATLLFGAPVKSERVIGETLRRATAARSIDDATFRAELIARLADTTRQPPTSFEHFINDPLAIWIETTFGLAVEAESGRLKRAIPLSISGSQGAAQRLATLTGVDEARCVQAIQQSLLAGYQLRHPVTGFPVFAFRLHQFISRGDTVYTSLETPVERHITTQGQQFVPNDRQRILLPIAFCRECGQEYYTVFRRTDPVSKQISYLPRALNDQNGEEDDESGFLYMNPAHPWPLVESLHAAALLDRVPEDWLELQGDQRRVRREQRNKLPLPVQINTLGIEEKSGLLFHYSKSPFAFCLHCGVSYSSRQRSDYGKLASLSSEGRSTATTILSLATLRALHANTTLEPMARKLLSFTDNRQDASLQAGHFNDFVEVGLLRGALYRGVAAAGPPGVTHDRLAQQVFDAFALPLEVYAIDPTVKFQARKETERALREVLTYRIYQDLRRGWRVTSPNLEQCGLLKLEYASLDELCAAEEEWRELHPALADAKPHVRASVAQTLLDFLRRELAIRVDHLDTAYQERLQQLNSQRLQEPWALDEQEKMVHAAIAYPRAIRPTDNRENLYISGRSGFGLYLNYTGALPHYPAKLTVEEREKIIGQLFAVLRVAGLVDIVDEDKSNQCHGYQIPAAALIWKAGDGTQPFYDPIRVPQQPNVAPRTNPFFVYFYQAVAMTLQGLEAHEHTAQVPSDERQAREERFRTAELPLLFCSPTMELGVDIAQLNVVNLRNVPPTPANYAQRSGRAGRSGQPALVFTYCTTGSPHDQYFFKRPDRMVAGAVATPRLDLANEDLLRAHVYAVWLAEADLSLGASLKDLLDLDGDEPSLAIQAHVRQKLRSPVARTHATQRLTTIFQSIEDELKQVAWYTPEWLHKNLIQVEQRFEEACERWRNLYRSAMRQREIQNKIIGDATRSQADKSQARRLRAEAESQMELLTDSQNLFQSDFYSYRYFASEGFLPGYNFPRLPLSAYVPGRSRRSSDRDSYLNRPRFLAIAEFGPRSIIYHEGSRYIVNQVILPVDERAEQGVITSTAKRCDRCGHLHPLIEGQSNPDLCEQCGAKLGVLLHSLLRMQNVSTRRRDRINSDEEERMRMGYELISGVRFADHDGSAHKRVATVVDPQGQELLRLTYGDTATLWRINLGWRRRRDKAVHGFILDTERGYWGNNEQAVEDDPEDPLSAAKQRVVPYVQDRRNCLLIEPRLPLTIKQMASLQPALKSAIQVLYQVEDNELAAEPLPSYDERNLILLYESAEGGAGVLRQLLERSDALAEVAREALRICHFDPGTGADLRAAPGAREACEAACYDCLMSYYNQLDHQLVDRQTIQDFLLRLTHSQVKASPVAVSRQSHAAKLKALCSSELEKQWLDFLEEHNLRLPDAAQWLIPACQTRADFFYRETGVAIYIDGPVHDDPHIAAKDAAIEECLTFTGGLTVLRFRYDEDWTQLCVNHAHVFGKVE